LAAKKFILAEREVELGLRKTHHHIMEQTLEDRTRLIKKLATALEERLLEAHGFNIYYIILDKDE